MHPCSEGVETGGAEPGSAESGGAETGGVEPGGAEPWGAEPGGAETDRTAPGDAPSSQQLREWYSQRCSLRCGAAGAGGSAGVGAGGAAGAVSRPAPPSPQRLREWYARRCSLRSGAPSTGVPPAGGPGAAGGTGASGPGGAHTGSTGAAGTGGSAGAGTAGAGATGDAADARAAGGAAGAGVGAGGAGATRAAGGAKDAGPTGDGVAADPGVGPAGAGAGDAAGAGATGGTGVGIIGAASSPIGVELLLGVLVLQVLELEVLLEPVLLWVLALVLLGRLELLELTLGVLVLSLLCPLAVPGTHQMMLRPSTAPQSVPLPSPASSLPTLADPESDSLHATSPTVTRLLATAVSDPSFESADASALVAELVDFAARCPLDYAVSLVAESESVCPPSVGGECALGTDVLEDRQEEFECFAAAVPPLVSMLIAPEGDPDAPDIPTPRSYAEAIAGEYSSLWQSAMDAEKSSWKSTGTYIGEVPPPGANIISGIRCRSA
ncbi:unnamed protein product [Closterium sp. NIES-65]|nr:unnamed protein product [Closterium sp. NIES-65]